MAADGGRHSTDACKIVGFDSTDGIGLLSYAGLGMLADTDPGDWVASVFQGLDTDLRGYMIALTEAARSAKVRSAEPGHLFVAAGVGNGQPVIYTLTAKATGELSLKCHERSYAFMLAGAGGVALAGVREKLADDGREILDWIKKAEAEESHPREVTDRLVKWTSEARRETDDVGSRSIVAYRFVRDGEAAAGRCFYDGVTLEAPDAPLHHLSRGADMNKMFELMKKEAMGATLSLKETSQLIEYKRRTTESE
jgi:hypothetical protein